MYILTSLSIFEHKIHYFHSYSIYSDILEHLIFLYEKSDIYCQNDEEFAILNDMKNTILYILCIFQSQDTLNSRFHNILEIPHPSTNFLKIVLTSSKTIFSFKLNEQKDFLTKTLSVIEMDFPEECTILKLSVYTIAFINANSAGLMEEKMYVKEILEDSSANILAPIIQNFCELSYEDTKLACETIYQLFDNKFLNQETFDLILESIEPVSEDYSKLKYLLRLICNIITKREDLIQEIQNYHSINYLRLEFQKIFKKVTKCTFRFFLCFFFGE